MQSRSTKSKFPTEAVEQEQLCKWLTAKGVNYFAVPNGGKRHKKTAFALKKQGVKAGIPDLLIIDHPMMEVDGEMIRMVGVALELKNQGIRPAVSVEDLRDQPFKGASEAQRFWLNKFSERGWLSFVAYGALDAMLKLVSCGVIPVERFNEEEMLLLNRLGAQLHGEYKLDDLAESPDPDIADSTSLSEQGEQSASTSPQETDESPLEDSSDTPQ